MSAASRNSSLVHSFNPLTLGEIFLSHVPIHLVTAVDWSLMAVLMELPSYYSLIPQGLGGSVLWRLCDIRSPVAFQVFRIFVFLVS